MSVSPWLIITVDYEVFGNGQGCLEHCVLTPAESIMRIAERFYAPVTFFVETLEFKAMEQHRNDRRTREQVARAVAMGHDAQLHLHPQFWGADLGEDGNWRLNLDYWRIADVEPESVTAMVSLGKAWLEEIVNRPDYSCMAFRAGGWCIQPSDHVLRALRQNGLKIDSTVAPGFRNFSPRDWCDFRAVPALPFWRIENDVCKNEQGMLFEIPIVTGAISPLRHLHELGQARANGGLAPGCEGNYQGADGSLKRLIGKFSKLARLGNVMLDLSTMSADVLIAITEQWLEKHRNNIEPLPIVAIAHTKNFTAASEIALESYLRWARDAGFNFSTYGQWLGEYRGK